jgi:hypothetical protein
MYHVGIAEKVDIDPNIPAVWQIKIAPSNFKIFILFISLII